MSLEDKAILENNLKRLSVNSLIQFKVQSSKLKIGGREKQDSGIQSLVIGINIDLNINVGIASGYQEE